MNIPDFIIIGGMKCGTTTFHHILDHHPDVYLPKHEVHFFDMDDFEEHPEFVFEVNGSKVHPIFNEDQKDGYWEWYSSLFDNDSKIKGEDSTGYFTSEKAINRISKLDKKVKLVVSLRNPVSRTYSHYWHQVKAGRVSKSIDYILNNDPNFILKRSEYLKYLRMIYELFPKEQVHVIVFEEFLNDKNKVIKELCEFLEIDFTLLPEFALDTHSNKSQLPSIIPLLKLKNKLVPKAGQWLYRNHFPPLRNKTPKKRLLDRLIHNSHNIINPLKDKKNPPISLKTKEKLTNHFRKEFQGINEILGKDILKLWKLKD